MTDLTPITFAETDIDRIAGHSGRIAVFLEPEGRLDAGARRVNRLTKGALQRLVESERFAKLKPGDVLSMGYPAGMATVTFCCLPQARAGWRMWPLVWQCGTMGLRITNHPPNPVRAVLR